MLEYHTIEIIDAESSKLPLRAIQQNVANRGQKIARCLYHDASEESIKPIVRNRSTNRTIRLIVRDSFNFSLKPTRVHLLYLPNLQDFNYDVRNLLRRYITYIVLTRSCISREKCQSTREFYIREQNCDETEILVSTAFSKNWFFREEETIKWENGRGYTLDILFLVVTSYQIPSAQQRVSRNWEVSYFLTEKIISHEMLTRSSFNQIITVHSFYVKLSVFFKSSNMEMGQRYTVQNSRYQHKKKSRISQNLRLHLMNFELIFFDS